MLVLSRKKDEVLQIGPDIKIVITEIKGDRVRIGVDAPRELCIQRIDRFGNSEAKPNKGIAAAK